VDDEIVAVVLDIEGTNQIDTTTVDMLESLLAALRVRCVDLYLVRVMYPVRVILRRAGFVAKIGEDHMWHTISQGVREARIHYGLKEGVVDASGGYDSPAEEHEPRIVPTYFTVLKEYVESETAQGGDGDGDGDEGVTTELEESDDGADSTAGAAPGSGESPTTLDVLAAARGMDADAMGDREPDASDPGQGESRTRTGKVHKKPKVHKA
jgi:hypothetical protein